MVSDFAFDAKRSAVAHFFQCSDERSGVGLSGAERDFAAPGSFDRGAVRIFDVNAADVRREKFDGFEWIVFVVQQHVGRIEIHFQIGTLQIVECAAEQGGRFLTGFKSDGNRRCRGKRGNRAERIEERLLLQNLQVAARLLGAAL